MNFKLFMIAAAALFLSACGGDGGGTSTAQTDGTGTTIDTTNPTNTDTNTISATGSAVIGTSLGANSFEIGLIGDMPYAEQDNAWTNVRDELNTAALSFVVHLGNFKAFNSQCDDTYYNTLLNQFNTLTHPLVYTPGENDWATCNRIDNGAYYFQERLDRLRGLFTAGTESLGQNKLTLKRQSTEMVSYGAYSENALWTMNNVTFASVHVVGYGNNTEVPGDQASIDDAVTTLQRGGESADRQAANLAWLTHIFAQAKGTQGLMLFMHQGNPAWDYPPQAGRSAGVYAAFFAELTRLTAAYGKPVLLAHARQQVSAASSTNNRNDFSYFRVDKPNLAPGEAGDIRHLNRVEVFGDEDMHWVRVLVNPDSTDVFYVQPEIVDPNRRVVSATTPVGVSSCGFCGDNTQSFDVGVIADQPISVLPDAEWNNLIADMETTTLRFAVHLGNTRADIDNLPCTDGHFGGVLGKFNAFSKPFFYTPGENDWALCGKSTLSIPANPSERLARIRQFFTAQGNQSFGQETLFVDSQSDFISFRKYSENKMWSVNNVLFATMHTVGATPEATTANNGGTTPIIARHNNFNDITGTDPDEFTERQSANLNWIATAFKQATNQNAPGIAFFTHGHSDWLDLDNRNATSFNEAYGQIIELLRSEAITFGKPVLLVHSGSKDYFRIDKPLTNDTVPADTTSYQLLENFTRVESFGGAQHAQNDVLHNLAHWVRITVDPTHPDVFLIRAEMVETN